MPTFIRVTRAESNEEIHLNMNAIFSIERNDEDGVTILKPISGDRVSELVKESPNEIMILVHDEKKMN